MIRSRPSLIACHIVATTLFKGSTKDGSSDGWRERGSLYHLIKGAAHLAMHIKFKIAPRHKPDENHLHKAISRLAMAASIEHDAK